MEVADKEEYPSVAAFHAHLLGAEIEDSVEEQCVRTVRYGTGGQEIAIVRRVGQDSLIANER